MSYRQLWTVPTLAAAASLLFAGCAGSRGAVNAERAPEAHEYFFAILETGERAAELDADTRAEARTGHRARIEAMGTAGTLLLAGPFGEPRTEESWSGIFILNEVDLATAEAAAQSDPSVIAGLFAISVWPWTSDQDLRPLRRAIEVRKSAGKPFVPAGYVLALGQPVAKARSALAALAGEAKVICAGPLGGDREGQFLALLTAPTVDEASEWLTSNEDVRWDFSSLWATAFLGDVAKDR